MRNTIKRKTVGIFLCLFVIKVLLTSISTFADDKLLVNHEQKKEILVARDVTLEPPLWCGNNAFVVSSERFGLRWIDFINNKTVKIHSSAYVGAVDCTSDGEWLVYVDTRSSRWDKGSYERGVKDFWRYNLKTGKRQKFAVAEGGGEFSPDSKKFIFSGSKPISSVEQPEPKWELLWSKGKWKVEDFIGAYWLKDLSSILIKSKDRLFIEELDKNNIRQFNMDLGDIYGLKIDKHNKIYILSRAKQKKNGRIIYGNARLIGCQVTDNDLQCEDILKRNKSIQTYSVSPDGKNIAFLEKGNNCVCLLQEEKDDVQCVSLWAEANFLRIYPDSGASLSISPDSRWLTFTRPRKMETVRGVDIYTDDLFLIKLSNE